MSDPFDIAKSIPCHSLTENTMGDGKAITHKRRKRKRKKKKTLRRTRRYSRQPVMSIRGNAKRVIRMQSLSQRD